MRHRSSPPARLAPATGVAADAAVSVTFSESVSVDAGALVLSCGGPDLASASGGPATTFSLTYTPPLPGGADCTIAILAAGVHDTDAADPPDGLAANVSIGFRVVAADPCAGIVTAIPAIQGSGPAAAITGPVTTQGVVVGDHEGPSPTLRGFYLQDPAGDGDTATSDGLFVFNGNDDDVDLGDVVRVTGNASEFQGQTQISRDDPSTCAATGASVAPTDVTLPVASSTFLERYEGMLVRLPQTLSVTEHFQLGRFGQVVLSADGRAPPARPRSSRPGRAGRGAAGAERPAPDHRRRRAPEPEPRPDPLRPRREAPVGLQHPARRRHGHRHRRGHDLHLGRQCRERQRLPGAAASGRSAAPIPDFAAGQSAARGTARGRRHRPGRRA